MIARRFVTLGLLCLPLIAQTNQETVRFKTNLGDIDVLMLRGSAPLHVENFLGYVRRGDFNNTIIHRAASFGGATASIVQGGGFNTSLNAISSGSSVRLEYREANSRGTLAAARTSNPNSATNQWYFNVTNNSTTLGPNNDGFGYTVFGRIVGTAGLGVLDRMAAIRTYNLGGNFSEIPLQNYSSGNPGASNFLIVNSIEILPAPSTSPTINDGGAITVTGFGGFSAAAPGSWVEIYGTNFGTATREWAGGDFAEGRAPTSLEEVSVTIGGSAAFVRYVSPGQLNVQVPAGVATGGPLPVVVTVRGQVSPAVMLDIQAIAPGIYAPPSFKYNNAQFVTAVRPSTGALINSVVPGIGFTDAIPGETLLFYGVGFGRVTPDQPVAGQVITGTPTVVVPVKFKIGDQEAVVSYAGLVAGSLGLYQFNVVIPPTLTRGDHKVEIEVDGQPLRQPTLYLPVANPPAQ
jgi:uncharacterized protein (TIGR03437 family)